MFLLIILRDEEVKNFRISGNSPLNCILFDLTCIHISTLIFEIKKK